MASFVSEVAWKDRFITFNVNGVPLTIRHRVLDQFPNSYFATMRNVHAGLNFIEMTVPQEQEELFALGFEYLLKHSDFPTDDLLPTEISNAVAKAKETESQQISSRKIEFTNVFTLQRKKEEQAVRLGEQLSTAVDFLMLSEAPTSQDEIVFLPLPMNEPNRCRFKIKIPSNGLTLRISSLCPTSHTRYHLYPEKIMGPIEKSPQSSPPPLIWSFAGRITELQSQPETLRVGILHENGNICNSTTTFSVTEMDIYYVDLFAHSHEGSGSLTCIVRNKTVQGSPCRSLSRSYCHDVRMSACDDCLTRTPHSCPLFRNAGKCVGCELGEGYVAVIELNGLLANLSLHPYSFTHPEDVRQGIRQNASYW